MNNRQIIGYGKQILRSCGLSRQEVDLVMQHKQTDEKKTVGEIVVNATGDKTGEILIYEEIGLDWFSGDGMTAKAFDSAIRALGQIDTLTVRINSSGGDVFDGIAIHNTLARQTAKVEVHIDSLAASAASFIAMAGDKITMPDNAMMMVHNAWGVSMGNAADMTAMAAVLEKIDGQIAGMYAAKSGHDAQVFRAFMAVETWLTAAEAKEAGLADVVTSTDTAEKAAPQDDISEAVKVRSRVIQLTEDSFR